MTTREIDRIRFVTRHFNELQGLRSFVPLGLMQVSLGVLFFLPSSSFPLWLLPVVFNLGVAVWALRSRSYYRRSFGEVESRTEAECASLSVYSPAGPAPLAIERRPVNPFAQGLIPLILALALFLIPRMILPTATIMPDGSGVDPWAQLHPPSVVVAETVEMPRFAFELKPMIGQGLYTLFGVLFLGIWFWRGRSLSQSYYLGLGAALLGLGLLGSCLGGVLTALWALGIAWILPNAVLVALAHVWIAQILCGAAMAIAGLLDHWQLVRTLKPMREVEA